MKKRNLFWSLMASVAFVGPALAQDPAPDDVIVLEDITVTVTAQRRRQEAINVPISLRVLDREELDERIVKRIDGAFAATPNASMTSQRGGNDASTLSVRGVATTAFGADPTVAVYVDDVYVGNDTGFNSRMADLEQIEILRGPQGTLYGRNALGGAVNIRTGAPEIGVNSAHAEAGFGSNLMAFGQGTANVALGDRAAARLSFFGDRSDGWIDNAAGGPNLGNLDDYGGRLKVLALPTDEISIEAAIDYSRDMGRNSAYGLFDTVWEDGVDLGVPFTDETQNWGTSVKATMQTGLGELVSVTAYRGSESHGDGGNYDPDPMQSAAFSRNYSQYSQEVRLSNETEQADWTVGAFGFYSNDRRYEAAGFFPALPPDALFPGQPALPANYEEGTRTDVESYNAALFGDVTYHLTDRLDLIAGARGSYDHKHIHYAHSSTLGNSAFLAPPIVTDQSLSDWDVSPRVGLQFAVTDDINVYGTISRGYKPGGYNIAFAPNDNIKYGAESAINYEIGVKGEILDGRVGFSASAFYFDWTDQQVYSFNNNILTISNAPKSRSFGGEAEVSAEIVEGLMVYAGIGLLDAKFEDYPNAQSGADESGNWQPFASRFSGNATVEYRRPVWNEVEGVARVDVNYKSSFYWDTANTIKEPGYAIVNVRAGLEHENWSISAFAQNLFDQEYRVRAGTYAQGVLAVPGRPQTFGIIGSMTF